MKTPRLSGTTILLAGCGAGSLLLFLGSMDTGVGWKDSAEFIVAAGTLGIPHPPGSPLHPLLCRAFIVLSGLPSAAACNAVSALFASAAGVLVPLNVLLLFPAARTFSASAFAAWLLFTGIHGVLEYSGTAETYMPFLCAVLIVAAALSIARKNDGFRTYFFASYMAGLASCLHMTGFLLVVPVSVLFLVNAGGSDRKERLRAAVASIVSFIAGLTPYLYVPLRAKRTILLDWGSPSGVKRFADFFMAREFVPDLLNLEYSARLVDASGRVMPWFSELHFPAAAIAVSASAGAVYTWRKSRLAAACLACVFVFFALYGVMFGGGIDLPGYMSPPAAVIAIFAGVVVSPVLGAVFRLAGGKSDQGRRFFHRKKRDAAVVRFFLLVLPVLTALLLLPGRRFHRGTGEFYSEKLAAPMIGAGPSVFITGNTVDYFLVLYQMYLHPALRADVVPVYTDLLDCGWFREKVAGLIPVPSAPSSETGNGSGGVLLDSLLDGPDERRIFYTPDEGFLLSPERLRRCGALFEVVKRSRPIRSSGCGDALSLPFLDEPHYLERAGLTCSDHGRYCYETGSFAEALKLTEQASRFLPFNAEIGANLALILARLGRVDDAISHLDSMAWKLGDSYLIYCTKGNIRYNEGDATGAAEHFAKALEVFPHGMVALLKSASCHLRLGDPAAALDNARTAVEISPEDDAAANMLGECYIEMELLDRAGRVFRSIIDRNPGFERAWANLSLVYEKRGKPEAASAILGEGLAANPSGGFLARLLAARKIPRGEERNRSTH